MSKHTAIPWEAREQFDGWEIVQVESKPHIGKIVVAANIGKSDAEFIVTACNNFEAMKEALEIAKSMLINVYGGTFKLSTEGKVILTALEKAT